MTLIQIASNEDLVDTHTYWRQWIAFQDFMKNIPGRKISRRRFLDALSFLFTYGDHLDLQWSDGRTYVVPDLDEIFGDDPQMRWLSYYLQHSADEPGPYRCCDRSIERLRLINLFMRIRFPNIAAHF